MGKGKFEAEGRSVAPKTPAGRKAWEAVEAKKTKQANKKKRWPWIAAGVAVLGAALAIAGVMFFNHYKDDGRIFPNIYAGGVNIGGMLPEEAKEALREVSDKYNVNMVLTMKPEVEPAKMSRILEAEQPVKLVLTPEDTRVKVDIDAAVQAAYDYGRDGNMFEIYRARQAAESGEYIIEQDSWITVDDAYVRRAVDKAVKEANCPYAEPTVEHKTVQEEVEVENEDGETVTETKDVQYLYIHNGSTGRTLDADAMFRTLMESYAAANFAPTMTFQVQKPSLVDVDKLYEKYRVDPIDASYDEKTFEITDEIPGVGFDTEMVKMKLEILPEGKVLEVRLDDVLPEITREFLQSKLFCDILGEAHTPHTNIRARTNNLILACKAIDGTVLLPGQVFSFNGVVGERTRAKGYLEATAYVGGGASQDEIGGGVCQVASSIYYACLLADLKVIERTPHMYAVTYVPMGMDTTIYWGSLDYKFENNTPYPLRIEASVSDGKVHIILRGTEWKDYTIKMTYDTLATIPWETVEKEIKDESEYKDGEVIDTPYTGYRVVTYKTKLDKDGNKISTETVAYSNYNRRNKTVAKLVGAEPSEPTEPEPTEPKPTEPKPTEPKPTEPKPTEPEPTEPKPTEPEPTEPKPTEPEPTEPEVPIPDPPPEEGGGGED